MLGTPEHGPGVPRWAPGLSQPDVAAGAEQGLSLCWALLWAHLEGSAQSWGSQQERHRGAGARQEKGTELGRG